MHHLEQCQPADRAGLLNDGAATIVKPALFLIAASWGAGHWRQSPWSTSTC